MSSVKKVTSLQRKNFSTNCKCHLNLIYCKNFVFVRYIEQRSSIIVSVFLSCSRIFFFMSIFNSFLRASFCDFSSPRFFQLLPCFRRAFTALKKKFILVIYHKLLLFFYFFCLAAVLENFSNGPRTIII